MKRYDLVKLTNATAYKNFGLVDGMHGIVVDICDGYFNVLFFAPENVGKSVIVKIKSADLVKEKERLPAETEKELSDRIEEIIRKSGTKIEAVKIKNYSVVRLTAEKDRYAKYGIHKGAVGTVVDTDAVNDYIEVDFSSVDEDGNCFGECICVKTEDLEEAE